MRGRAEADRFGLHGSGVSARDLVRVTQQMQTRTASPVVELALREHACVVYILLHLLHMHVVQNYEIYLHIREYAQTFLRISVGTCKLVFDTYRSSISTTYYILTKLTTHTHELPVNVVTIDKINSQKVQRKNEGKKTGRIVLFMYNKIYRQVWKQLWELVQDAIHVQVCDTDKTNSHKIRRKYTLYNTQIITWEFFYFSKMININIIYNKKTKNL